MLEYWKGEVRRVEEQYNEQTELYREKIIKEIEERVQQRVEKDNKRNKKISKKLYQLVNIYKMIEIKNLTKWFFRYKFASFQSEKNKSR